MRGPSSNGVPREAISARFAASDSRFDRDQGVIASLGIGLVSSAGVRLNLQRDLGTLKICGPLGRAVWAARRAPTLRCRLPASGRGRAERLYRTPPTPLYRQHTETSEPNPTEDRPGGVAW
jgi:hypothetical protein